MSSVNPIDRINSGGGEVLQPHMEIILRYKDKPWELEAIAPGTGHLYRIYRHVGLGKPIEWKDVTAFSDYRKFYLMCGKVYKDGTNGFADQLWRSSVRKFVEARFVVSNAVEAIQQLMGGLQVGVDFGTTFNDRSEKQVLGQLLLPNIEVGTDFGAASVVMAVKRKVFPGLFRVAYKNFLELKESRRNWTVYAGCESCLSVVVAGDLARGLEFDDFDFSAICENCLIVIFEKINFSGSCSDWHEDAYRHVLKLLDEVDKGSDDDANYMLVLTRKGLRGVEFCMERSGDLCDVNYELVVVLWVVRRRFYVYDLFLHSGTCTYDIFDVHIFSCRFQLQTSCIIVSTVEDLPAKYILIRDGRVSNHSCGGFPRSRVCDLGSSFDPDSVHWFGVRYDVGYKNRWYSVLKYSHGLPLTDYHWLS